MFEMLNIDSNKPGLLFANRCKSIPVFNSTCFWLNEYYNRVKTINVLTKYTMQLAETTIKTSICLANPFMEKFKDKVQALDSIACQQLDRLEAAFPILLEDTSKVVNEGKSFITKTVQPAVNKINTIEDKYLALKNYSLSKVESVKHTNNQVIQVKTNKLVKRVLDASERFIEAHFLDDYVEEDKILRSYYHASLNTPTSNDVDLANRARMLTCALYCGLQRKFLRQINILIHSLDAFLDRLNALVDLLNRQKVYIKVKFQEKMQKASFYKEYLELLIKQMMVQDGRSLDHVHSADERNKILIRRSLGNLLTALYLVYKKLNVISMNTNLREKFYKVMDKVINSYKYFQKGNNMNGLSGKVLNEYQFIIHTIQISVACFLSYISKTAFATWLVPNFDVFGVINDSEDDDVDPQERNLNENLRNLIELEAINNNVNNNNNEDDDSVLSTPKLENRSFTNINDSTLINNTNNDGQNSSKSSSTEFLDTTNSSTIAYDVLQNNQNVDDNNKSTSTSTLDTNSQKNNNSTSSTSSIENNNNNNNVVDESDTDDASDKSEDKSSVKEEEEEEDVDTEGEEEEEKEVDDDEEQDEHEHEQQEDDYEENSVDYDTTDDD